MSSREDDLIAEIESAFADVRLEDGISLNMTEYNDSGGSNPRYLERAKHDERDDWRRIADETLENFRVTLFFHRSEGLPLLPPRIHDLDAPPSSNLRLANRQQHDLCARS